MNMKPGDHVAWKWGNGIAEGRIASIHRAPTMIATKGKSIRRNGSKTNPALIIEHRSGSDVLKLSSEVQKTS